MKDNLFDTKSKRTAAVANFKQLISTAGWQLLKQIVDANIRVLQDQILDGDESMTKEQMDRKRDKLRAYKDIIGTPEKFIDQLEERDPVIKEDDPYHTYDTLLKDRQDSREGDTISSY